MNKFIFFISLVSSVVCCIAQPPQNTKEVFYKGQKYVYYFPALDSNYTDTTHLDEAEFCSGYVIYGYDDEFHGGYYHFNDSSIYASYKVIEIPSYIEYEGKSYKVTGISDGAFAATDPDTIILPNTIEYIGSVGPCRKNGIYPLSLFGGLGNKVYDHTPSKYSKAFTIPNSVTYIDYYMFAGGLLSFLRLPDQLDTIRSLCYFDGIVDSIVIPNNVKVLGRFAFEMDSIRYNNVTLPKNIKKIDLSVFGSHVFDTIFCPATIPPQLTCIDDYRPFIDHSANPVRYENWQKCVNDTFYIPKCDSMSDEYIERFELYYFFKQSEDKQRPVIVVPCESYDAYKNDASGWGIYNIQCADGMLSDAFDQTKVYPNPVEDMLYIESKDPMQSVTVHDEKGQEVIYKKLLDYYFTSINLVNLPTGIYLIKIQYKDKITTKKITKL